MIEAKQASISIFLSVIFLSLIILSCSIVDLSRYYIGKVQGQRAVNLAHQSVMAGFDSQLALQYGVFGLPKDEGLLDEFSMYVEEGLSPGSIWNNYAFENKQIVSSQPMLKTAYLKDQITQYMKYRGPYLGIEALLGKLEFFEKGTKTGEIIALNNAVAEKVDGLTSNGFLEDIYISEYIMHMFNHSVTKTQDQASGEASTSLNNLELSNHKYNGEIEYIIFGNKVLKLNLAAAVGVIFVLRVIMNGLHIASSPAKVKLLTDIAVAIAGWWSLGIGVLPVMIGLGFIWACFESASDILELLDGKKVPLLKTEANWNTDLDGILGMGTSADDEVAEVADGFSMGYEDYLRIMLYLPFTSEEKKLLRIMDLAQINISHQRGERVRFNDYIYDLEVQGDIEVNPLFLQLPFMPESIVGVFGNEGHQVSGYYCYQ